MTTQATHTPGPWKEKRKLSIYSADDEPICAVFPAETEERSRADAHLIAAAPDLLAALKSCRSNMRILAKAAGSYAAFESTDKAAREAIEKATGRATQ
jgi:hypothetical protein